VIDRPDDPVNALNLALVEDLATAVSAARAYEGLQGLLILSGKPEQWVAGADLKLLPRATAVELEAISRRFQAVCDQVAWLPCTTVAALNGPALGGGCELALACDYRVAADTDQVSIGQPEVSLGLIPAGGGTQRLPRLLGLARGLDLLLTGRRLNPRRAQRVGLLDEAVHPAVLEDAARSWARRPKRPLDRPLRLGLNRQGALELAEQTPAGRRLMYQRARAAVLKRTRGHYPAPLLTVETVAIGMERGVAAGLDAEARALAELGTSKTARHLIWLFLASQHQKRGAVDRRPHPGPLPKGEGLIGVVGAGFMGAAIAEVVAAAGLPVRVKDVSPEAVARGLGNVGRLVREGVSRRRFLRTEATAILQRVSGTTDYSGFRRADLVIEAVFEDVHLKRQVVTELEAIVRPDAVIATNTSALPIQEIVQSAAHPERVVGMHFFSPAHRMPLVEVVRAAASADWAVARVVALGQQLGKTPIVVGDAPGFYTSRVLGVMLNEAVVLLSEGEAIEEVDAAMTSFGFPVGPFVLYDEVGLEVAMHAGETVLRALGDRLPSLDVVPALVKSGATGRAAGRGFYQWPERQPSWLPLKPARREPNPDVYRLAGRPSRQTSGRRAIQTRLALLFVNEAIRCLDEGVLASATDGDLGAVLGLGFPPFTGGPFHYADSLGLPALCDRLADLAVQHGPRYAPAEVLVARARQGQRFFEDDPNAT
jgi:3-hydroxyacyl-CoA dehydrogenase/enoyl-CoA hydratase/3-hydroxybutyryl-CoA epimerase